ncbi:hybrid sensor histidine kinase/response regulator [Lentilitoribacter sp. Alg239-R112]|uniref:ATP-binding response regulator n=1 Tax=Lentilitoribacter sp. Alg239-R112 TaxID=2305987 RepID=UPI0013A6FA93|nr:hybrid sensor histidine kinase/response regulator [Lentilitoribacter sp. Alg239-R112]
MISSVLTATDFPTDRAKLFARAPAKIFYGHIASACVLIYLASDVLPVWVLVLWGCWEIVGTPIFLYILGKQIDNSNDVPVNLDRWQNHLHILFALVGLSWGAFISAGLDVNNPAHFSIQMAIVAGASAAAARSLGMFKYSFYFYEIPFTGLLAVRIFSLGDDYMLLGVLVLIFMGMLCRLANDTSEELSDYLATKSENLDLAKKYQLAAKNADDANAAKTQFLTQANHDLRQPIHAIGLLTECLRDQQMTKEGDRILDTIDKSVDSLAKLFKSLLNITSLESGALKPEIVAFPLDEITQLVVRQAHPEALQYNTKLTTVKTSIWVKTDKALLTSILQNLVFNSVKYARGSKILIGARKKNGCVSIHVLDQGMGIPQSLQSSIFSEFVRANPHGPERVEGLGLGLAIVARTAKLLNLDVQLQSVEGMGTHIIIDNLEQVLDNSKNAEPTKNISSSKPQKGTLLIIDDNKQVLEGLDKLLTKWGYNTMACNPIEDTLPSEVPDLVVTDFHLNGKMDGIELAKQISKDHGLAIPTLIISGTLSPEIEASAKRLGYWTLLKPASPVQLRSTLIAMKADC